MFISDCNQLAYRFIRTYRPDQAPPLAVLHGPEGLGKATLLACLDDQLKEAVLKRVRIDALKFSAKYAYAAQNGQLSQFRKYMRSRQLILLENIDRLSGKTKTAEELFHTIETVIAQGGKAVFTYNGTIPDYSFLGVRFASRLHAAVSVPLHAPRPEEITAFCLYYLATEVKEQSDPSAPIDLSHIRLTHCQSFSQVIDQVRQRKEADKQNSEDRENTEYRDDKTGDLIGLIHSVVGLHYEIDSSALMGTSKKPRLVEARYMSYLLLHEAFGIAYPDIAKLAGKTTGFLRHYCQKLKHSRQESFETLCQKLYNQQRTCKNSKETKR